MRLEIGEEFRTQFIEFRATQATSAMALTLDIGHRMHQWTRVTPALSRRYRRSNSCTVRNGGIVSGPVPQPNTEFRIVPLEPTRFSLFGN